MYNAASGGHCEPRLAACADASMRRYSMPVYRSGIDAEDLPIVKRRLFRKRLVRASPAIPDLLLHVSDSLHALLPYYKPPF